MLPTSCFAGRLVYSDHFLANGTADVNASTHATRFSVITENPSGAVEQLVTGNGGSLEFQVSSGNSVGAYGDSCIVWLVRPPQIANLEILVRWAVPSSSVEQYYFASVRSDNGSDTQGVPTNCYSFQHVSPTAGGDANIRKNVSGADTFLIGDDQSLTTGDCWMRGYVRGTSMGVRTWQGTVAEPRHFATTTDVALPGRGFFTLGLLGGNSGTDTFTMDTMEYHVWDLDSPPQGAIR